MNQLLLFILFLSPLALWGQTTTSSTQVATKPSYCEELPIEYSGKGPTPPPLPVFPTTAVVKYKVQVAILRRTHPMQHPFHKSLVARYRPCEEVWVVESKDTWATKAEADAMKKQLATLGYKDCFVTEVISYE